MNTDQLDDIIIENCAIDKRVAKAIINKENLVQSMFCQLKLDDSIGKAVYAVIYKVNTHSKLSPKDDSEKHYYITDLKGGRALLNISASAHGILGRNIEKIGLLVALLSPVVALNEKMNILTLSIHHQQNLLVLGMVKYFGVCGGTKRDGKPCAMPIDKSKSIFCQYHQNTQNDSRVNVESNTSAPPAVNINFANAIGGKIMCGSGVIILPKSSMPSSISNAFSIKPSEIIADKHAGTTNKLLQSTVATSAVTMKGIVGQGGAGHLQLPLNNTLLLPTPKDTRDSNRICSVPDRKMVGGVLVNLSNTISNSRHHSEDVLGGCGKRSRESEPHMKSSQSKQGKTNTNPTALARDIDELLAKRSSHCEEAKDEVFESNQKRLSILAKKEESANATSLIHSVRTRAIYCSQCNLFLEIGSQQLCRDLGHILKTVVTQKKFFECAKCRNRIDIIGSSKLPERTCSRCNSYEWRPCGKAGSVELPLSSKNIEDRLICTMSYETSSIELDYTRAITSNLAS
jgi:hypothetical protein